MSNYIISPPYTYLIVTPDKTVSYTNYFEYENHFVEGMTVVNLLNDAYTTDGKNWNEITEDHL